MTLEEMWQGVRRGYRRVNAFLEEFYRHGPAARRPSDSGILRLVRSAPRYVTLLRRLHAPSIPRPQTCEIPLRL